MNWSSWAILGMMASVVYLVVDGIMTRIAQHEIRKRIEIFRAVKAMHRPECQCDDCGGEDTTEQYEY